MTKQEEILKLRELPNHYLWETPRNQWTKQDLENLKYPNKSHFRYKQRSAKKKLECITSLADKQELPPAIKPVVISKVTKPYIMTEQFMIFSSSMNYLIDDE
jgi:hypothetical protein